MPAFTDVDVDIDVDVDVGKGRHHAVALDRHGKRLYNKALPTDEVKRRDLIAELNTHRPLLFVVDQLSTIRPLPLPLPRA
ncbi:IS110 family transposase [Burkholderia pseudomallei]|uniref:IS110 family transposase n=1 Tax=Burkholderia pseudomallei TaxID=28450 RepID=UPI003F682BE8